MTPRMLVRALCMREGKKKQVDIAQMTETVGHLADYVKALPIDQVGVLFEMLDRLGEKRQAKRISENVRRYAKARKKSRRK